MAAAYLDRRAVYNGSDKIRVHNHLYSLGAVARQVAGDDERRRRNYDSYVQVVYVLEQQRVRYGFGDGGYDDDRTLGSHGNQHEKQDKIGGFLCVIP